MLDRIHEYAGKLRNGKIIANGVVFPGTPAFFDAPFVGVVKKRTTKKIYFPFLLSLIGTLFILTGRMFLPVAQWPVITGILLLVLGSLSNGLVDSKRTDSLAVPVE